MLAVGHPAREIEFRQELASKLYCRDRRVRRPAPVGGRGGRFQLAVRRICTALCSFVSVLQDAIQLKYATARGVPGACLCGTIFLEDSSRWLAR